MKIKYNKNLLIENWNKILHSIIRKKFLFSFSLIFYIQINKD